ADAVEPANRLCVVNELLDRHLIAPLEEPPPRGAGFTPVVLEELTGEPTWRSGLGTLDEGKAQSLPLAGARVLGRLDSYRFGPPRAARPVDHQPVTEGQRRAAVLLVVGDDAREHRSIARVHPALVGQHGARPAPQLGPAHKLGEGLDLLERIAWHAGPQSLAHDRVEVHEDLPPEQL